MDLDKGFSNRRDKSRPPFQQQSIGAPPGLESRLKPRPDYKAPAYKGSGKLEQKRAFITGGDSGIGRAVAVLFAREGANIAISCLPEENADADETLRAVNEEGRNGIRFNLDVTDFFACQSAVSATIDQLGGLDILVNNAAIQNHVEDFDHLSIEQWRRTFMVNIFGYFYMVKAALPYLKPGSVIINTGSILGYEGSSELVDYSTTKGAIHTFTKSLAKALSSRGVRVNSVAPGPVWTPLNPAEREDISEFGKDSLYGRPAQPEEIAPAYVYLASNITGGYVTGETINLFGDTSGGN